MVGTIDPKYMIGEVAARHGIKIDAKDPIMAVVTLNELAMMQYTASVEERIEGAGKQFERAASRLQELAASVLADEVGKAGIALRREIQTDIHDARLNANQLVVDLNDAHKRDALVRLVAITLTCALIIFLFGVWIGWKL